MKPVDFALVSFAGMIGAWLGMILWRRIKKNKK